MMVIIFFLILIMMLILMAWVFRPPKHQLKQKPKTTEIAKTSISRNATNSSISPPKIVSSDNKYLREQPPKKTESLKIPSNLKKRKIPTRRHQRHINHAESVLKWLRSRSPEAEFPVVIAVLRRVNPYVFEELLLSCCQEQGWQIQRNTKYSGDGGVDGRVLIFNKLYLLQAKRYTGFIKSQHIQDFQEVIKLQGASGGLFIHSGKTGELSKELLRGCPQINLLSGQRLVDFVLGKPLRITIPPE